VLLFEARFWRDSNGEQSPRISLHSNTVHNRRDRVRASCNGRAQEQEDEHDEKPTVSARRKTPTPPNRFFVSSKRGTSVKTHSRS